MLLVLQNQTENIGTLSFLLNLKAPNYPLWNKLFASSSLIFLVIHLFHLRLLRLCFRSVRQEHRKEPT